MTEKLNFAELKAAGTLPSPKGIALRVMHLCQSETVSLPDLASAIQSDPALAGRLIKLANYVNPNKARPIASVAVDTLLLIGIHAVRQAVLCMSLISNYRSGPCRLFDYEYFWSLSVARGAAAQAVSQMNRVAPPAEIFNCGLMMGLGQLALVTARPEEYNALLESRPQSPRSALMEAEREAFGIDQREMMVLLLQDWGLPQLFIDAMYHQDDPQSSAFAENSRAMRLTYTLQLAALIAHACLHGQDDQALRDQLTACSAVLGFGPEQLELLHEQSLAYWRDWAGMLHITTRQYRPRPLDAAPIEAPTGTETMPEPAPRAETPLDILIACAEDDQRILLEKFLKASGHRVTSVDNGLAAFDAALQHMPQVLIADWLMPGADGLKLCADLRKTQAGRKMYFVLMTPFEDERRKMEAYQAGVDELLRTPVNTRLLAARLLAAQRTANHNNKTPP